MTGEREGGRLRRWPTVPFALVFLAAGLIFLGVQRALMEAVDRSMDLPGGVQCAEAGNLYRPPCTQQVTWAWISSAYFVLACVVGVLGYRWRRELVARFGDSSPGHSRRLLWTKHVMNVLVPGVLGLVLLTQYLGIHEYGEAFDFTAVDQAVVVSPVVAAILAVGPSIVSMFDIHTIATGSGEPFVSPGEAAMRDLAHLRQLLDRFLSALGALLAAWLLVSSANGELIITVNDLAVAVAGGGSDGSVELTIGKTVVAGGLVLSGLLALLYIPIALAIDDVAARVLRLKVQQLRADHDERTAAALADQLRAELASGRSVTERVTTVLTMTSPLTSAVFTTFVF